MLFVDDRRHQPTLLDDRPTHDPGASQYLIETLRRTAGIRSASARARSGACVTSRATTSVLTKATRRPWFIGCAGRRLEVYGISLPKQAGRQRRRPLLPATRDEARRAGRRMVRQMVG
jgi:hypothetical protein